VASAGGVGLQDLTLILLPDVDKFTAKSEAYPSFIPEAMGSGVSCEGRPVRNAPDRHAPRNQNLPVFSTRCFLVTINGPWCPFL
jgi:hypothetical protein